MNPQDDNQTSFPDDLNHTAQPEVTPVEQAPTPTPFADIPQPQMQPQPELQPQPQFQSQPHTVDEQKIAPGILVLQWLSYAFWGWTLLALSALIFIVIFHFINQTDSGNGSLYALAAIVVLLPISLVCDFFYQKHEQKKKTGVSMAIMVIHAVIFALFAIGTLIASLFSLVQLIVNSGSTDATNGNVALCISLLIISALYGVTFFRTLNPLKRDLKVARIFSIVMLSVVGLFTILAFAGPFVQTLQTKQDRKIDANLTFVQSGVRNYVRVHNKLPATLADTTIEREEAKQLLSDNLVTYKQDSPSPKTGDFRYQLCVTYKHKDTARSYGYGDSTSEEYSSYVNTTGHPAGDYCYKLSVSDTSGNATYKYQYDSDSQDLFN